MGWSGLYTLNAEIYSTEVRGSGVGWGNALSKLSGIIAAPLAGAILDLPGGKFIMLTFIAIMLGCISIICLMFKETRPILKENLIDY